MAELNTNETHRLISADKVQGTVVYNSSGDKLGTVEDVMIDKTSGKVAYAVMSFGGFLGIGEKYHPLPWSTLTYDTKLDGYNVPMSKEVLEKAPTYGVDEKIDMNDRRWGEQVHRYYNVDPYWV
jgi:sporulation protein YlmC with PRC-barrel domain